MLNTPQDIEDFKAFQGAGGLKTPETKVIASGVKSASESLSGSLSACIDSGVDYEVDGIQSLPDAIATLSSEALASSSACGKWIAYIDLAAEPTDIEQVAIGVDVLRKLEGAPSDKPAPSMLPITSKGEINDLKNKVGEVAAMVPELSTLMTKINAALQPTPGTPDPTDPDAPVPDIPPPPLPVDLKRQAVAMEQKLSRLLTVIGRAAAVISSMASEATSERVRAIQAFNDCIGFTLVSGQKKKPIVSDAANEIYPS